MSGRIPTLLFTTNDRNAKGRKPPRKQMNGELIRIVEAIHRDKDIEKETIFQSIEAAVASATKKHFGRDSDIQVELDRETGELRAFEDGEPIDPEELGRIAAQSAKQIMIQKIREAERDVIFQEFEAREDTIVTGLVQRYEGGSLIVSIDKIEGVLTRRDLIPGDSYRPGDTLRSVISEVRKVGSRVRILLSRSSNEFVTRLFELEVPEIHEGLVEIKAIARIPGYRTKVAIKSNDPRIDSVGACVGVRGSRIKNIVSELNGEKIDIIEWSSSPEIMIVNALKPAEISKLEIDDAAASAKVIVTQEQLSLAIGKRGQNVRLASRLTGWELEIVTEEQDIAAHEALLKNLTEAGGIPEDIIQNIIAAGYTSIEEIIVRGAEVLAGIEGVEADQATAIIDKLKKHVELAPPEEQGSKPEEREDQEDQVEEETEQDDTIPSKEEPEDPGLNGQTEPEISETDTIELQSESDEGQEQPGKDKT